MHEGPASSRSNDRGHPWLERRHTEAHRVATVNIRDWEWTPRPSLDLKGEPRGISRFDNGPNLSQNLGLTARAELAQEGVACLDM